MSPAKVSWPFENCHQVYENFSKIKAETECAQFQRWLSQVEC